MEDACPPNHLSPVNKFDTPAWSSSARQEESWTLSLPTGRQVTKSSCVHMPWWWTTTRRQDKRVCQTKLWTLCQAMPSSKGRKKRWLWASRTLSLCGMCRFRVWTWPPSFPAISAAVSVQCFSLCVGMGLPLEPQSVSVFFAAPLKSWCWNWRVIDFAIMHRVRSLLFGKRFAGVFRTHKRWKL